MFVIVVFSKVCRSRYGTILLQGQNKSGLTHDWSLAKASGVLSKWQEMFSQQWRHFGRRRRRESVNSLPVIIETVEKAAISGKWTKESLLEHLNDVQRAMNSQFELYGT